MKIAIVKLSALGDIVHAMVALQFIKRARPDLTIDWLVEEGFAGVLQDNPDINQVLTVNLKSLKKYKSNFFTEIAQLKDYASNQYDMVIDAQGLIKSAVVSRILSANVAGFDSQSTREKPASWFYKKQIAYPYDANTIDRNVAVIGQPLEVQITEQQIINKAAFLFYTGGLVGDIASFFAKEKANILFVIGSTWASRNYPKEKYLRVIEGLEANSLIIWGSEQEKKDADWIASHTDKAQVLPRMNFNLLKAALDNADLVIGNDTGPTHMAWGVNTPSITLFGPTPVSRVYQTDINKVLKSSSTVNPYKLDKNDFSIKEIKAEDVIELAKSLLSDSS